MQQKNIWLRTLNVRTEEVSIVKKLFLLQFFQGAGIAFFLTASLTLLLDNFEITKIPYVFIYAAVFLWTAGFIYSKLEHKFNLSKLGLIITVFMIVSILFFRLAFMFFHSSWFIYLMLPWFYVLYLLNNLEFWGVAALLFDARQSKRLFGVISAGDIPAKLIGYSMAGLAVHYIGTINLLWAALACMIASIPFLVGIKEASILHEMHHHKDHSHKNKKHKKSTFDVRRIIENYSGNALVRRLAALGILVSGSFLIVNFAFLAKVKQAYHTDVSLANFIAFFNAIISIIFLIVKLIFTSRLINKLGIIKSLLITPIVMLILISTIIITQDYGDPKMILYFFGAAYTLVDILRTSINNPVFLTIMQPLPNHERLRAHMILKGITDPFAFLFSGIVILALIQIQGKVNLVSLSYVLLAMCILWFIGVYLVNVQYLKTIVKSISNKFFNLENFSVKDSGTLEWLRAKAKTGSETEIINILNMLNAENDPIPDDLIISLLHNPSEKVKSFVLNLMMEKDYPISAKSLPALIKHEISPSILASSIKVICKNNIVFEEVKIHLDSSNIEIRDAALDGLFFYSTGELKERARAVINKLITSENKDERLSVAKILSQHNNCKEEEMILQLMNDEVGTIRKYAFITAGKSGNSKLLDTLINQGTKYEFEVIEPLLIGGDLSLPAIYSFISANKGSILLREKLILLIGRINSDNSHEILIKLLNDLPGEYPSIIKAIYRSSYVPKHNEREAFITVIRKMLTRSAGIVYIQNNIIHHESNLQLLSNALSLELDSLRENLLLVFAILYNRDNINKVRKAYASGNKTNIINAMEILDITARKDIAYRFNLIFEPGNIAERLHEIQKIYPDVVFKNTVELLNSILSEEISFFNTWTLACAIYVSKKQNIAADINLIIKHQFSENLLLKEMAEL
ncbi:MAG: hypothetical protein WCH52_01010 [Bacteroidota bacterium]